MRKLKTTRYVAQDWTRTNGWGGVGSFSIFSLLTLLSPSHHYANTKVANSPLTPLFFRSAPGQSQFFSTGREVIQDCQPISIKLKQPKSVGRRLSIWVRPETTFLVLTKGKPDLPLPSMRTSMSSRPADANLWSVRTEQNEHRGKKSSRYACGSSHKHLY